jgi:hypothetical protein
MKKKYGFVLMVCLLLILGCAGASNIEQMVKGVKVINHPKPDLKVDFSPFEQAGCPSDEYNWRPCQEDSELYKLGCDNIETVSDLMGGLNPAYPMAVCRYFPTRHPEVAEPYNIPSTEYFFDVGGPLPELVRYVIYRDGGFQLIRNPDEFKATFAPVETEDEALGFALALQDVYALYDQKVNLKLKYYIETLEDTRVESMAGGFLVHVFDYQFFGCGPHYTYAVDLKVGNDGVVEEVSRTQIFKDPLMDGLCQD